MTGFENLDNSNGYSCSESGREALSLESFNGNFVDDDLPRQDSGSLLKEQVGRCNSEQPLLGAFLLEAGDQDALTNTKSTMKRLSTSLGEDLSYVAILNEDGSSRIKILDSSIGMAESSTAEQNSYSDSAGSNYESCSTRVQREDYEWIDISEYIYNIAHNGITVGEARQLLEDLDLLKQEREERERTFYRDALGLDPGVSMDEARTRYREDVLLAGMKERLGLNPDAKETDINAEMDKWNADIRYNTYATGSPAETAEAYYKQMRDNVEAVKYGLGEGSTRKEIEAHRLREELNILGGYFNPEAIKSTLRLEMFAGDLKHDLEKWVPCETGDYSNQ